MLNNQQKKAVETTDGRLLILAGAGSGKTSVITHRICHLINHLKVSPRSILGLTFTNKGAEEMRKRIEKMIDPELAKQITLCTFHSFCMQVLRKEIHRLGYTRNFSLYDEKDVRRLINQIVRHLLEHDGDLPSLESTIENISQVKNKDLSSTSIKDAFSRDLFEKLQVCMRAYNAVDFDSLLSLTVQLFQEHAETLQEYQEHFRYIMIDEYQDTNPIQYKLALLLSQKYNNLCVVGDDDQAIYGWRGAEIKNILNFESSCIIKLEQNYRSTPHILEAANAVIQNNRERHVKSLWSDKEKGSLIQVFHAPTENDEAQAVVQRLLWFHKNMHVQWKDMAILYRSNILSRPFEMALMQAMWKENSVSMRGIPYQIFGGTEFYERSEIKDLCSYLRVILNPQDQEAILRVINCPRRGISEQSLDSLTQINRKNGISLWEVLTNPVHQEALSEKAKKGVGAFVHLIKTAQEKFEKPPLSSTFQWLVDSIDYKKAIKEEVKSEKMREFKWENVNAFIQSLSDYEETQKESSLADFLGASTLNDHQWSQKANPLGENKVNLMTFHGSKGLEFQVCFLVGLEDHIIPHEKSLSEGSLEEERRLMYVAMTRAKKNLTLSMARQRKRYGKDADSSPSRFLFEIPKELLKVTHWNAADIEL